MKTLRLACAALALALPLAACGEKEVGAVDKKLDSAAGAIESVDLSKLSPDALKQKAQSSLDQIAAQLAAVKDSASAKALVAKFQPVVDQLAGMKATLTSANLDLSGVKNSVEQAVARFKDDPAVTNVLQPLIDKLRAFFS